MQEPSLDGIYFYNARWYDPAIGRFLQADTIIPGAGNPQAWDRYAYTLNNPIRYSDPSGHWPDWNGIGQFFTGVSLEFARTSNWMGAIVSPDAAANIAPSPGESDAMLAGRVIGDVLAVAVGVLEVSGGIGIAGGGAVVGCATTLCVASAPAIAAGVAVAGYGVGTSLSGAAALGENLGRAYAKLKQNEEEGPYPKSPEGSKGPYQSPYGFPSDPSKPPANGFSWKGSGKPGTNQGNWLNPNTGEWFHWDPNHHGTPHYDYSDPGKNRYRIWPDGSMEPK